MGQKFQRAENTETKLNICKYYLILKYHIYKVKFMGTEPIVFVFEKRNNL